MAFAHDHVVDVGFHTLVIFDKGEDEVLLFLGIYQMAVRLVVPFDRLDVIDVEVEPELGFQGEAGEDGRHED